MSRPFDNYLTINDLNRNRNNETTYVSAAKLSSLSIQQLPELEKKMITEAMKKAENNKSKAAKILEISRNSLLRRIEKYGLSF